MNFRQGKRYFFITMIIIVVNCICIEDAFCNNGDYVILLHGIARTARSMKKIEKYLNDKGYDVINYDYASRKYDIQTLSEQLNVLIKLKI